MITKREATKHNLRNLMDRLVASLSTSGFITHTLAQSPSEDGSQWFGVSCLPDGVHRRLDLFFVPWEERGAASIHFTGNDVFNRSLRLLAKKKNMRLNQRGLYEEVLRGPAGDKVTTGIHIAGQSERQIFEILGVPWRIPEERNC